MATNAYECMLIFDSNKYAQDHAGVSGAVNELITKNGGEVLVSRLFNEQKLAYQIDHHRKGTYWLIYFKIDGSKLTEINSALRINENVIRSLTLKIHPRLVEALVAHASGTAKARPIAQDVIVEDEDDVDADVEAVEVE